MSLTQILAWLSGPGAGIGISWLLEQWIPWQNWKPKPWNGLDPKGMISGLGALGVGLVAYAAATNIPASTISTIDPYVSAGFPLITLIITQIWHAVVNKRLTAPATISVPVEPGSANVTIAPQPAVPTSPAIPPVTPTTGG